MKSLRRAPLLLVASFAALLSALIGVQAALTIHVQHELALFQVFSGVGNTKAIGSVQAALQYVPADHQQALLTKSFGVATAEQLDALATKTRQAVLDQGAWLEKHKTQSTFADRYLAIAPALLVALALASLAAAFQTARRPPAPAA